MQIRPTGRICNSPQLEQIVHERTKANSCRSLTDDVCGLENISPRLVLRLGSAFIHHFRNKVKDRPGSASQPRAIPHVATYILVELMGFGQYLQPQNRKAQVYL